MKISSFTVIYSRLLLLYVIALLHYNSYLISTSYLLFKPNMSTSLSEKSFFKCYKCLKSNLSQNHEGIDVICVSGPNGMYSTEVYGRFRVSSTDKDNINKIIEVLDYFKINPSLSREECRNSLSSHANIEFLEIYCNNILYCGESPVYAVIGNDGLLTFIDIENIHRESANILTKVLDSNSLRSMNMKYGLNEVKFVHRSSNQVLSFDMW